MSDMTTKEALSVLIDIASRWGENEEEGFTRRLKAEDTDADAIAAAEGGGNEGEDGILVRDLWRAIEHAHRMLEQRGLEVFKNGDDGTLPDFCDVVIYG